MQHYAFAIIALAGMAVAVPLRANIALAGIADQAATLRHINRTVVPVRCGDIDLAKYLPNGLETKEVAVYVNATVELFKCDTLPGIDCGFLEHGTCKEANFTKPNNPPFTTTPWLTPGFGEYSFDELCLYNCKCVPVPAPGSGDRACTNPCTTNPCDNPCQLCTAEFNAQREGTQVDLFCDPSDPACALGLPSAPTTIVDRAVVTPDLSILVDLLRASGLIDDLSGAGPFTVFAPTNAAFAELPAGTLDSLLDPANKAELVKLLTYHVVARNFHISDYTYTEKFRTVEGSVVTADVRGRYKGTKIEGGTSDNLATVLRANVEASNGVVHVVDNVLIPPPPPRQ